MTDQTLNPLFRLMAEADGTVETSARDLLGRLTNVVDRTGRRTGISYAVGGKIAEVSTAYEESGTNASCAVSMEYDLQGFLRRVVNRAGENAETYVLDGQDRVVAVTNSEGQSATFRYLAGNRLSSATRFDGSVVGYSYDANGNPSAISYPDEVVVVGCLANGLLLNASCGSATNSYAYDGAGRVVAATNSYGGVAYSFATNLAWAARASGAGTEIRHFDLAGRLTNVTDEAGAGCSLSYNHGNALLSAIEFSCGIAESHAYDASDRIAAMEWRRGTAVVERLEYAYTNFSQVASVVRMDGTKVEYAYDGLRRLPGERRVASDGTPVCGSRYEHGVTGNRRWKASGAGGNAGIAYSFEDGDRLDGWRTVGSASAFGGHSAVTNATYHHEAAGCLTNVVFEASDGSSATIGLAWNGRYLLTGVSTNGATAVEYSYDPEGRLLTRTDACGKVGRVYDGAHLLCEVDAANGDVVRSFTHGDGIDSWLGYYVHSGGETNRYTLLTDIAGAVFAVADENGCIVERYEYDAWGRVLAVLDGEGNGHLSTRIGNTILWKGGEYDWATGFYLFRARWYDPVTGRWLSKDPIGIAGGLNLYEYCGGDPVNNSDPNGTDFWIGKRNLHRNINIGRPNGEYTSYSFALDDRVPYAILKMFNPFNGIGEIYRDSKPYGVVEGYYTATTVAQDEWMKGVLEAMCGFRFSYSPFFFNCRSFSHYMYDIFTKEFEKRRNDNDDDK